MSREYKYPVWGTQGGGVVRDVNGTYIFVEKPDCPGLGVGDEMPEEWGIANDTQFINMSLEAPSDIQDFQDAVDAAVAAGVVVVTSSEYPDCPTCPDGGRVGPSAVGGNFYCYECSGTF